MSVQIQPGSRVVFHYRVFADQQMIDSSSKPVSVVIGEGKFFKAVEEALIGHRPGERVIVLLPPEEHYGPYDPKKLQVVPAERLPAETNPGQVIHLQDEMGILHPAIVRRIDPEMALVDFNHPFAGKLLRFEVEILDVKPPEGTQVEKSEMQGGE